jgi:hypothetical protein
MILHFSALRKRKISLGIIVLMLTGLFVYTIWYDRRPDIPLEALLADMPVFPVQWTTGNTSISGVKWTVSEQSTVAPSIFGFPNVQRTWSATIDGTNVGYKIEQVVANYHSPFVGWVLDRLWPLEKANSDAYSNLNSDQSAADRYPTAWSYKSATANHETIICASGAPNSCYIWLYRAQYGQYMMLIRFYTLPRGSDPDTFAQVIAQIDKQMSQQLSK